MTVRSFGFSWIGVLVGAPLLLGLSLLAASPAGAQVDVCNDEEDPQADAYESFEDALETMMYTAEKQGSTASARDCTEICKTVTKSCKKTAKANYQGGTMEGKFLAKGAQATCKTATDNGACKTFLKEQKKAASTLGKAWRDGEKTACDNAALATACIKACEADQPDWGEPAKPWTESCEPLGDWGIFDLSCNSLEDWDDCCEIFTGCD